MNIDNSKSNNDFNNDNDFDDDEVDWEDDNNDDDWDDDDNNNNNNNNNNDNNNDIDNDIKSENNDDDWDDVDINNDYTDITEIKVQEKEKIYEVLSELELKEYQLKILKSIQETLSMDLDDILIFCWHYKWNESQMMDEYLMNDDSNKIKLKVGVKSSKPNIKNIQKKGRFNCYLCLDDYDIKNTTHAGCGHQFCINCFSKYLETCMEKGPKCILTKCIEPKCNKIIKSKYWIAHLPYKYKLKYNEYLLHSFVYGKSNLIWCPGVNCKYAVKINDIGNNNINIKCKCGYEFCFNCRKAIHLPCNCKLAEKWLVLHKTDSENVTWARANGKQCKKCGNYIEKNQGCNHMTVTYMVIYLSVCILPDSYTLKYV